MGACMALGGAGGAVSGAETTMCTFLGTPGYDVYVCVGVYDVYVCVGVYDVYVWGVYMMYMWGEGVYDVYVGGGCI